MTRFVQMCREFMPPGEVVKSARQNLHRPVALQSWGRLHLRPVRLWRKFSRATASGTTIASDLPGTNRAPAYPMVPEPLNLDLRPESRIAPGEFLFDGVMRPFAGRGDVRVAWTEAFHSLVRVSAARRQVLSRNWSRLATAWCRAMHADVTQPRYGYYQCRTCQRSYRVPW